MVKRDVEAAAACVEGSSMTAAGLQEAQEKIERSIPQSERLQESVKE